MVPGDIPGPTSYLTLHSAAHDRGCEVRGEAAVTQLLLAGGPAVGLLGAALTFPVIVAEMEGREMGQLGIGVLWAGCLLMVAGLVATCIGLRRRRTSLMPTGVRVTVAANVLFLAFFA